MKPNFPLLREFCRGYLHQDALPEHGGARNAAKTYVADLSDGERKQLAAEAAEFRAANASLDASALNRQLCEMGSAWSFGSFAEFEQVLRIFERQR